MRKHRIISNKPGEYNDSVSFGCVTRRVKVISSPNDKKFMNGDILVTKSTDPGWTPLIINSEAIVLEIKECFRMELWLQENLISLALLVLKIRWNYSMMMKKLKYMILWNY